VNLNFYKLLAGSLITNVGGAFYTIVITTLVYKISGSATLAAFIALVRTMGMVLGGLQIGFYAERFAIQKLISGLYIIQSLVLTLLILQLQFLDKSIIFFIIIYFIEFINSFMEGLINPSRNSLIPLLVPQEYLLKANSMLASVEQTMGMMSWLLGGILVAFLKESLILVTIIVLYICASFLFSTIKLNEQPDINLKSSKLFRFDGWYIIKNHPFLKRMLIVDTIEGIASGIWIGGITLAFAIDVLNKNEAWWGYINTSYYAGTILGAGLLVAVSNLVKKRMHICMALGSFGVSVILLLFALNKIPYVSLTLVLVIGIFYQLRDSTQRTLLQYNVNKNDLTTFYGFYGSISNIIFGLSVFIMGAIADLLNPSYIYLIGALMSFITSIIIVKTLKFDKSAVESNASIKGESSI
jgi:MFS family permease